MKKFLIKKIFMNKIKKHFLKLKMNFIRNTKKSFKKKHVKDIKIFLKKKKKKDEKRLQTDMKIFLKKKKENKVQYHREQKKVEYIRNYHLTHKS